MRAQIDDLDVRGWTRLAVLDPMRAGRVASALDDSSRRSLGGGLAREQAGR